MRRFGVVGAVVGVVWLGWTGLAWALTPGWECVPTTAGQAVTSGGTGAAPSCGSGTAVLAPTFVASGVGGKATVEFSGVNVQVVDGLGKTSTVNGTGNLVLGYDENPSNHAQSGSHDLILGEGGTYTGYSELLDGYNDTASGSFATALGYSNTASGSYASVTGGFDNATSNTITTRPIGTVAEATEGIAEVTAATPEATDTATVRM